MKITSGLVSKALLLTVGASALSLHAQAQLTVSPGYSISTYYTHTTSDDIVSFDWDASSNLYYMTQNNFADPNVWVTNGGAPVNIYSAPNNFAGASVTTVGNYVYFNDSDTNSDEFIRAYGPLSGSPSVSTVSTASNFSLLGHNGALFISGADSNFENNIYYSPLTVNGTLSSAPVSLGNTGGASGPMAFDSAGNLYYAPGFSDESIYKWSAAEVAAAIADPTNHALSITGHVWENYTALFPDESGATSMLLAPDGNLLVTLTSFSSPSDLVEFDTNPDGSFDGTDTTILTDGGPLGEIREQNNNVYVAADNEIVQVVPEPAAAFLAGFGGLVVAFRRRRKA